MGVETIAQELPAPVLNRWELALRPLLRVRKKTLRRESELIGLVHALANKAVREAWVWSSNMLGSGPGGI